MKPAVVYPLLTTAFLLLLTFSPKPQKGHRPLRLGHSINRKHAQFDPLVEKWERLHPEEGWNENDHNLEQYLNSSAPDWKSNPFSGQLEDEDPDEYFSEKGQININGRLLVLFPWLDRSPRDGFISLKELEAWNVWRATNRLNERTLRKMSEHDKDRDHAITFDEYLPHLSDDTNRDNNDKTHGQAGWWKEQFLNADIDGNDSLNFTEFNDFLHPEESDNEKIQLWLVKEKIQGMDHDKDGKLNFIEFHDGVYDIYKNYIEFENDGDSLPSAEEKFAELDVNMDKYLAVEELRPLTHHLNPGELSYAKYYTKYLIKRADDDKDGKLTLDEMLNNPYIFYSTVVQDSEFEDDDDLHDELR